MWNWIESGCMRELVRIAPLLLAVLPVAARSAVLIPVSQSTITVTGAGLNGETYNLTKAYGDWFYTAQDAHASLTLLTGAGAHQAQLSLEWDGRALTQTIDRANNDSTVNNGTGGFVFDLHLKGTGVYGQELRPGGGDAITVTITKMDDQSLEATFAGTATGTAAVRISGAIKLHRSSAGLVSGTFGGCDPHIYDKLAGAESSSPATAGRSGSAGSAPAGPTSSSPPPEPPAQPGRTPARPMGGAIPFTRSDRPYSEARCDRAGVTSAAYVRRFRSGASGRHALCGLAPTRRPPGPGAQPAASGAAGGAANGAARFSGWCRPRSSS